MRDAQGRGGRRGRSSGRGRGSTRHNNKSNEIFKEYKLAEERFVEKLYKAKFGVNNQELSAERLQEQLPLLFKAPLWQDDQLMSTKMKLNSAKTRIDGIPIEDWNKLAKQSNKPQRVVQKLREQSVEMATIAWAKMYECLNRYKFFPPASVSSDQGTILMRVPGLDHTPAQALRRTEDPNRWAGVTVHLCEAPGAFVAATNHFIRTKVDYLDWDWRALTLSPYFVGNDSAAMVEDDALIVQTKPNWHFGSDESGDIRRKHNIRAFWENCKLAFDDQGVPGAVLVTADGSIDCQEDPNEQEAATASLHFAELVAALGLLSPGGSAFLKAFTILEHSTVTLLYIAGALFDKVDVYKPITSKANNSETYIVARGFRGISDELLQGLLEHVGDDIYAKHAMLQQSQMPGSFLTSVQECGETFALRTQEAIERTLAMQSLHAAELAAAREVQDECSQKWLVDFKELFLSGRDNRVDKQRKSDFKGTLSERREKYQDRRDAQGQATNRLLKRMREEQGLDQHADRLKEPAPLFESGSKIQKMMAKMGHKDGQGLGVQHQGTVEAVREGQQRGREGLGFGMGDRAARMRPQYSLMPDAQQIQNYLFDEESGTADMPSSEEIEYGWAVSEVAVLPADVMLSKIMKHEVFLNVKRHRRGAQERLRALQLDRVVSGCLCHHTGSCIAPRVTGRFGPGFWKLACLDMQLGFYDADPTLSPGTQAFTSYFLRPTQPSCPMSFLSLASYDSSCVEYLVHAHRAPHHSLALGSGYCLGIASSCQESSDVAFPGWTQHILLNNQSAPPVDASQEAKLQAFTAESCSQVAAVAGLVDTVIGDLCDPGADAPEAQQLSVWLEYNRVLRRRLVWEAAMVLSCCRAGGCALLRVPDLLTTFTIGLLNILHRCFRHFTLVKPFTSCTASAESCALFVDRLAQPELEEGDLTPRQHLLNIIQVLERMYEVEAVTEPDTETKRPEEHLLVSRHLPDVVPPEVYLGNDVEFVDFIQGRANELGKRQAKLLEQLAKEDPSARPTAVEIETEVQAAVQILFSSPDKSSQAMEEPDVLQEEDGVKVLNAVITASQHEHSLSRVAPPAASPENVSSDIPKKEVAPESVCGAQCYMERAADFVEAPTDVNHSERDYTTLGSSDASVKTEELPRMRKKRKVQQCEHQNCLVALGNTANAQRQDEQASDDYVTRECVQMNGCTLANHCVEQGAVDGEPAKRTTDAASPAVPSLPPMLPRFRSGVCVRSDDAFIGWSKHIRQCDEQEVAKDDDLPS